MLWRSSGGYLFAIDDSHRLSTLSCWINDDNGDGTVILPTKINFGSQSAWVLSIRILLRKLPMNQIK